MHVALSVRHCHSPWPTGGRQGSPEEGSFVKTKCEVGLDVRFYDLLLLRCAGPASPSVAGMKGLETGVEGWKGSVEIVFVRCSRHCCENS